MNGRVLPNTCDVSPRSIQRFDETRVQDVVDNADDRNCSSCMVRGADPRARAHDDINAKPNQLLHDDREAFWPAFGSIDVR